MSFPHANAYIFVVVKCHHGAQRLRYKGQQTHRAWITSAFIKVYYSLFSSLLSQIASFMFNLYLIRYVSYVRYILFSPDIPMGMAGEATKLQALVP